jgi:hypothetical protein
MALSSAADVVEAQQPAASSVVVPVAVSDRPQLAAAATMKSTSGSS